MGSKDAPQKLQFSGKIKKSGKSERLYTKRTSGGKPPQIQPSQKQSRSECYCSCIFQEPMNRGKYAYIGLWVKNVKGKVNLKKWTAGTPEMPLRNYLFVLFVCFHWVKNCQLFVVAALNMSNYLIYRFISEAILVPQLSCVRIHRLPNNIWRVRRVEIKNGPIFITVDWTFCENLKEPLVWLETTWIQRDYPLD